MRLIALAALAAACVVLLGAAQTAQASPGRSCTTAELDVLQIPAGYNGWLMLQIRNLMVLGGHQVALDQACGKIPAAWRALDRDFKASTRMVDRLYPGRWYGAWARRCASSEGGHGAFVMNHSGSGAGGWLQFMSGTFWSVIYRAVDRAQHQGVRVPGYTLTWTSPVGQAIAGAEMLFRGRRGEWSGSTC